MDTGKKLPVGLEDFEEIRREDFYYIDKTGLIKELLSHWGKVNLFTRPRRFGKSLNMSMLKYFFEYGCDQAVFNGLEIADETELCETYMGKYPVIFITLKGVTGGDFDTARSKVCSVIGKEALRFQFLQKSDKLTETEKEMYMQLITVDKENKNIFLMSDAVMDDSLQTLSLLLQKHYGQKVIILIDEYDVPLDKAQQFQYYDEMVSLIHDLFSQTLKSNPALYFAVLTGCLRVSKESIFTGLNNPQIFSVTDVRFDEYFGFRDFEVRKILNDYGMDDKYELMKKWYDGYHFGNTDVYCPWDVINYCAKLRADEDEQPQAFWSNTSGNDIVRRFVQKATKKTRQEMERLINGEEISKRIHQELTYRDLYKDVEHLWSVLFATGYLTQRKKRDKDEYGLVIPNLEIRQIFIDQIREWFQEEVRKDTPMLDAFCRAFLEADVSNIEKSFNQYLGRTISIRDTNVRKVKKENFYHGILLGLLSHREDWDIDSNAESGNGYSDILVEAEEDTGFVIEIKYSEEEKLDKGCKEALKQIEEKHYEEKLREDGMTTIRKYGIACNRKKCKVLLG